MRMLSRDNFSVVRQNPSAASVQEEYIVKLCCTELLNFLCGENDNRSGMDPETQVENKMN